MTPPHTLTLDEYVHGCKSKRQNDTKFKQPGLHPAADTSGCGESETRPAWSEVCLCWCPGVYSWSPFDPEEVIASSIPFSHQLDVFPHVVSAHEDHELTNEDKSGYIPDALTCGCGYFTHTTRLVHLHFKKRHNLCVICTFANASEAVIVRR